jgi:hypothetical protein
VRYRAEGVVGADTARGGKKKNGKKSRKGGMLLSLRRRGNTSWSVFTV